MKMKLQTSLTTLITPQLPGHQERRDPAHLLHTRCGRSLGQQQRECVVAILTNFTTFVAQIDRKKVGRVSISETSAIVTVGNLKFRLQLK